MPKEAFEVHGLGDDFLRNQPVFKAIGQAFLDFIADAQLVIHNAAFDMKFLNHELKAADLPGLPNSRATDTLMIARSKFPGSPASLDALCRRFGVDNSAREKHGALLDSEILAEVYLEADRRSPTRLRPQPVRAGQAALCRPDRHRLASAPPRDAAAQSRDSRGIRRTRRLR